MIRRSFAWSLSILITVTLFPLPLAAQQEQRKSPLAQNPAPDTRKKYSRGVEFSGERRFAGSRQWH